MYKKNLLGIYIFKKIIHTCGYLDCRSIVGTAAFFNKHLLLIFMRSRINHVTGDRYHLSKKRVVLSRTFFQHLKYFIILRIQFLSPSTMWPLSPIVSANNSLNLQTFSCEIFRIRISPCSQFSKTQSHKVCINFKGGFFRNNVKCI